MLVFVDESGCTGVQIGRGSSPHLVLVAVVFNTNEDARRARAALRAMRTELGWHPKREFKFNSMDKQTRLRVCAMLKTLDFRFWGFVLNKAALYDGALRKPNQMYTKVVQWVFENAMTALQDASVVFDSRGDADFYTFLDTYLKRIMAQNSRHGAIREVRADNSHEEDLLQMADVVCGALNRYYTTKPDSRFYLTPIWNKAAKIQFWPKTT